MRRLVRALRATSRVDDVEQVLDVLWLASMLPGTPAPQPPAPPPPPRESPGGITNGEQDPGAAREVSEGSTVTVEVPAAGTEPSTRGVYAQAEAGFPDAAGRLRARAVRVAGVPALRDVHLLSLALRPLGRRRASMRLAQFDEEATVERYAETLALVPRYSPRRDRFFDAVLLVEECAALPLWRSTVDELEQLLQRRVGLRSLRRLALETADGAPRTRDRIGQPGDPLQALEGDAPLVLVATDGTSPAWADGRMAATVDALGARAAVVVLQLLPPRLWANTALGGTLVATRAPDAGAALNRLAVDARGGPLVAVSDATEARGLAAAAAVVPVAGLQPPLLARWAAMQMAWPGATAPAALLWRATAAGAAAADPGDYDAPATPPTPDALVARIRAVAPARVLQAAVYLSAAAPLTLAVVRLVHRVMLPDAPAEDLPLLLLCGLLVRRTEATGGQAEDDALVFDFAAGVRGLLQRSLLLQEALRVRHAVSTYIAERAGLPGSFVALLEDPQGDVVLPEWARPFAEVAREVDALFAPGRARGRGLATKRERVQELERAAGVTVRSVIEELAAVTLPPGRTSAVMSADGMVEMAYSPDGESLAVRHAGVVDVFHLPVAGGRASAPQRMPTAMTREPQLLVVKGWGLDERLQEEAIAALRGALATMFDRRWENRYHTCLPIVSDARRSEWPGEVHRVAQLALNSKSVVCAFGDKDFLASPWMRDLRRALGRMVEANPDAVRQHASRAGRDMAAAVRRRSAQWLGDALAMGPDTVGLAWLRDPSALESPTDAPRGAFRPIVVDRASGRLSSSAPLRRPLNAAKVDQAEALRSLHAADGGELALVFPDRLEFQGHAERHPPPDTFRPQRLTLEGHPAADTFPIRAFAWSPRDATYAVASWNRVDVGLYGPLGTLQRMTLPHGPYDALAWRADGTMLALASRDLQRLEIVDTATGTTPTAVLDGLDAVVQLAWSPDGCLLACVTDRSEILLLDPSLRVRARWRAQAPAMAVAFSPRPLDERFFELAVGSVGHVELLRVDADVLLRPAAEPATRSSEPVAAAPVDIAEAAPAAPPVERDPIEAAPVDPELLLAALNVLQAFALTFHVGRLTNARPADALSNPTPFDIDPPALAHWMRMSEYVFRRPVRTVLTTGEDPIRRRHPADDETAGGKLLRALRDEMQGTRGAMSASRVRPLWVALDTLRALDPRAYDEVGGAALESWASAAQPDSGIDEIELPGTIRDRLERMAADPRAALLLGRCAGEFYDLFSNSGPSELSRSADYVQYMKRLLDFWVRATRRLFERMPDTAPMEISFQAPVHELERAMRAVPWGEGEVSFRKVEDGEDEAPMATSWSVRRQGYLRLVDGLGPLVLQALQERLSRPPRTPVGVVLDNDGDESFAYRMLRGSGYALRTRSHADMPDLDRPPDAIVCVLDESSGPLAALTLLDELRARGWATPVVLFGSSQQAPLARDLMHRGALGYASTNTRLEDLLLLAALRANTDGDVPRSAA